MRRLPVHVPVKKDFKENETNCTLPVFNGPF